MCEKGFSIFIVFFLNWFLVLENIIHLLGGEKAPNKALPDLIYYKAYNL